MALSGSLTAGYWYADNGQSRGYTLNWSATQSIANNQSTITWWVDTAGTYPYTVAERTLTVTLAGQTLISKTDRVMRGAGRVASGSFTVTHDSAGNLSISGSITAAVYTSAVNCSNSTSWSLNTIARQANISTAPNFNDEGNPAITYSNPAGTAVTSLDACISLTGSKDDIPYRAISKTGTSYTFNLTDAERATLRNACTTANSRTVKFFVRTVVGGTTFYSTLDRTLTIINANPTFTAAAADTMAHSIELTGDSSKLIKGYNTVAASITAAAYKGATISSYKIVNGGTTINSSSGTFTNAENGYFSFEVTDSRGNKATSSITLDMVNYIPLTVNVDGKVVLSSVDSTKADVSFIVNGNYFNGTFGAVANTLTGSYIVEANDGERIEAPLDIPADAMSNGTYKVSVTIPNLDYRKTYVVSVIYSDAIYSNLMAVSKTLRATPVFDWGEEDFNFNVDVTINGISLLDIFYPVGSIYQSTEYFNPADKMGGEWEQIEDRFLLGAGNTYQAGTEVGSATHNHDYGSLQALIGSAYGEPNTLAFVATGESYGVGSTYRVVGSTYSSGGTRSHNTAMRGNTGTSSNIPPSLVVYMWQRIA